MQSGRSAAAGPTKASIFFAYSWPCSAAMREEQRRHPVVARHAAAVGVHPAEAELGLGVAQPRRLAVELGGARGIAGHALAMLVGARLGAQRGDADRAASSSISALAGCTRKPAAQAATTSDGRAATGARDAADSRRNGIMSHRQTGLQDAGSTPWCARYHGIAARIPSPVDASAHSPGAVAPCRYRPANAGHRPDGSRRWTGATPAMPGSSRRDRVAQQLRTAGSTTCARRRRRCRPG